MAARKKTEKDTSARAMLDEKPAEKAPAKKAEPKADVRKVGSVWDVPSGSFVRRPNGTVVSTGRGHVLDIPGEYVCGDESVTAK